MLFSFTTNWEMVHLLKEQYIQYSSSDTDQFIYLLNHSISGVSTLFLNLI